MKTKFVAAVAVLAALSIPATAQNKAPAAAKVGKAEVQKLVDGVKADKTKNAEFCDLMKLEADSQAAADKKDDKKLEELDKKMEDAAKKLGPDFEKVTSSDMDEDAAALLEELAKTCK
jgi:hypothetical protein